MVFYSINKKVTNTRPVILETGVTSTGRTVSLEPGATNTGPLTPESEANNTGPVSLEPGVLKTTPTFTYAGEVNGKLHISHRQQTPATLTTTDQV